MSAIIIREPGPATSVQDLGRPGARRWGVPVCGTLAPEWLRLANALVGNEAGAAGLEFRLAGPRFEIDADALLVAVGGPAELRVESADGARTVPPWTSTVVARGDTVAAGRIAEGALAVLAVSGGIDTPPFLGSRATYARAGLGGHEGRPLKRGDRLPVGEADPGEPKELAESPADGDGPIRATLGPQADHFEDASVETLLREPFAVTDKADRMGMRLAGPGLRHRTPELAQIASDGIVPGAMQVPGNGEPIVLLADGQTVGGYPKIATVISADLPRLARLAPGAEVRFAAVDVSEAEDLRRAQAAALERLVDGIRPARSGRSVDLRRLYESNIVGGVVDIARPDHFPGHLEREDG